MQWDPDLFILLKAAHSSNHLVIFCILFI
jgi:hypothetical protein